MAKSDQKPEHGEAGGNPTVDSIKESATQIWLAGLGAFAKAQAEGEKMFDALVQQGQRVEKKSKAATEARVAEMKDAVADAQDKASDTWDKLERVFETRVARVLGRMGVPSDDQVAELTQRVEKLEAEVKRLRSTPAARTKKKSRRKTAKK